MKISKLITAITLGLAHSVSQAGITYLDQGWDDANQARQLSYHTSQGSQLIPYDWFLNLEVEHSAQLLRSHQSIKSLGFLPDYQPNPALNPDGLPVGFVKDQDPLTGSWIGVNCAACHTAEITFRQHRMRIDGGPAMGDFVALLTATRDSLAATLEKPSKFRRFLHRTGRKHEEAQLRAEMQAAVAELDGNIDRAQAEGHVAGYGRVDAFNSIHNEVLEHDLGIPANRHESVAPVSYPAIWDTPDLQNVQYTGHIENPYARNVGQVLGVLGRLELQDPSNLFASSVRARNVFLLEEWLRLLKAPVWPESMLGAIDKEAAARGKTIYVSADATGYSCADCHSLKDDAGHYPLTPASENIVGRQFIRTYNIPLSEVGTDPNTLMSVYNTTPVQTGALDAIEGVGPEMIGIQLLSIAARGTVQRLWSELDPPLSPAQQLAYSGFRVYAAGVTPPTPVVGYRAKPLAGIWATAPYLHNGSVPSLYELLLPPAQRTKQFWVGSTRFDRKKVGFVSDRPGRHAFLFDTSISGNRNTGHRYGTELLDADKRDLLEFLKTL